MIDVTLMMLYTTCHQTHPIQVCILNMNFVNHMLISMSLNLKGS